MKKRNKKYNPLKQPMKIAKYKLEGLMITLNRNVNVDKCVVMSVDGAKVYDPLPQGIYNAIGLVRHKWHLYLACVRRERNGKEGIVVWEVPAPFEVFHTEINDSLASTHKDMLDRETALGNEVLNVGWIATTVPLAGGTDEAERLLSEVVRL